MASELTTTSNSPTDAVPATTAAAAPAPAGTLANGTATPVVDEALLAELPTFELFFKTFGFKRVHGRVWGLLVLSDRTLSSREISSQLDIAQGTTSTTLNELTEWGAIRSEFDSSRRCHLHAPVGNALSIVATVFRRREQVVFQQFKQATTRSLEFITARYGPRDPRVVTLRSILTTCEIGEALMELVFSAVGSALGNPTSILSKAIHTALKVGVGVPARVLFGDEKNAVLAALDEPEPSEELGESHEPDTSQDEPPSTDGREPSA